MHALGEHIDRQRTDDVSAQRAGEPEPLVVAGLRVETHHETWSSDIGGERLDVRRQVDAAALLARLDEHDAARVRDIVRLQRRDGRERGEDGIAVVGGASAIQAAVAEHRLPGSETLLPAGEFGLLVEMAVEQYGVAPSVTLRRHLDEDQRRAAREPRDAQGQSGDGLTPGPLGHELDRALHMAMPFPVRIEQRGLVRDAYVLAERGNDRLIPDIIRESGNFRCFQAHGLPPPECSSSSAPWATPTP